MHDSDLLNFHCYSYEGIRFYLEMKEGFNEERNVIFQIEC